MVKSIKWPLPFGKQDGQFKLDRIKIALDFLENPERKLKNVIHIAGTNGKGSTMAFLEKILLESGFSVSSYISPSLIELNERFRINSFDIKDELLLENIDEVEGILTKYNYQNELTFFEGLTVVAFYIFAKINADFNIIEVGLGGRFDATNVFESKLASIITQISFDHTEYLGDTIAKIATEKVQICCKDSINIMSYQDYKDSYSVFSNYCDGGYIYEKDFSCIVKQDRSFVVKSHHFEDIALNKPSLEGYHQYYNCSNAVFASKMISKKLNLEDKITNLSISKAISSTFWQARMQKVFSSLDCDIIVDGGHNEGSVVAVADFLKQARSEYLEVNIIYGALQRKDIGKIFKNLKQIELDNLINKIFLTQIETYDKAHDFETLKGVCLEQGITNIEQIQNLKNFLSSITKSTQNNTNKINKKLYLVFGSLYLCANVIEILQNIT
jgi:dihydrofolate synthase/folylpolyglutamate synthase